MVFEIRLDRDKKMGALKILFLCIFLFSCSSPVVPDKRPTATPNLKPLLKKLSPYKLIYAKAPNYLYYNEL